MVALTEEQRADEAIKFFHTLYGKRKVSLARATITGRKGGKGQLKFHEGESRFKPWSMSLQGHIRSMIKKSDNEVEIFYAPTPMSGTKGRKKEQALPNLVVFGDADEGLTADVKARLIELGACLVRSGGITPSNGPKYHVYLLLTEEVSPPELERLNRGLKAFIKGDKFDATTLLRVPGTRNHKYPSSPLVRVERYADARHTPENLTKFLGVVDTEVPDSDPSTPKVLPQIPEGFDPRARKPGYAHVWRVVKMWNGRWDDPTQSIRRYTALYAICGEAIERGLSIDEAYAFSLHCEPLLDKQEEENGFRIQRDIVGAWKKKSNEKRRENAMAPSGTLVAEDIQEETPSHKVPATFGPGLTLDERFAFQVPNLDELLAGDYVPLEPTLVPCGSFFLLYAGKSHSLVADRGVGKTMISIAMVQAIMKAGGRVVYFDFEDTPDTFIRDRMMNQYGITAEQIKNQFLYVGGSTAELDVMDYDEATEYLAEQVKDWDLVIIDGVSASMGDLDEDFDGNKDVDYKKWHKIMVQPFLDQGLATLQLDHSTKSSPRAGGTMQKGAKLTGVEYQVRTEGPNSFTIGRTGKVIIEAVKDRVGRISKHRRTTPPTGHDSRADWPWNDVATFTLSSDDEGHITQAKFEPINYKDSTSGSSSSKKAPTLNRDERKIMEILVNQNQPMAKTSLKKACGINHTVALAIINDLIQRGYIHSDDTNRGRLSPSSSPPPAEGEEELDFSQVDRKPKGAKRKLECHRCRDFHEYPEEFIQADEIGYQPGRRLCRSCAGESIESESYQEPRDGAEWAREIREKRDRRQSTHEDD